MPGKRSGRQSDPNAAGARDASTRQALIRAATIRFGEEGYAATSIRAIASDAGANIALISYHFGGKQGLYEACANAIIEKLSTVAGSAVIAAGGTANAPTPLAPPAALAILERTAAAMVAFLVASDDARPVAMFMLRELTTAGPVLDRIYSGLIEPVHAAACRIWAVATGGDAESAETKLAVFSLLGQVVYFRIARPVVMRRLAWREITAAEADAITRMIITNLRATINVARAANGFAPLDLTRPEEAAS